MSNPFKRPRTGDARQANAQGSNESRSDDDRGYRVPPVPRISGVSGVSGVPRFSLPPTSGAFYHMSGPVHQAPAPLSHGSQPSQARQTYLPTSLNESSAPSFGQIDQQQPYPKYPGLTPLERTLYGVGDKQNSKPQDAVSDLAGPSLGPLSQRKFLPQPAKPNPPASFAPFNVNQPYQQQHRYIRDYY